MKHVGDITKIQGFTLPRTDVVTGGSPCQDLSVAGKRAGLKHEDMGDEETTRSGLYMEQIRVIKEMRENDQLINGTEGADIRPRYMVWENVPGAFSSNKGEDFRAVLEEAAKVCDETATIPGPDKGKWHNSGAIVGDGWSIAWRVFDAQFWGVPQRRRRIYLVADFGGQSAPEILFKREGLPGYPAPSRIEGQGTATYSEGSLDEAGGFDGRGRYGELVGVAPFVKSRRAKFQGDFETWVEGEVNPTLNLFDMGDVRTTTAIIDPPVYCLQGSMIGREDKNGPQGDGVNEDVSFTLNTIDRHAVQGVIYDTVSIENHPADSRITLDESGKVQTLTSRMGTGGGNVPMVAEIPITMQMRSGKEGGGKGPLIQENLSATLMAGNGQTLFEPTVFSIDRESFSAGVNFPRTPGISDDGTVPTLVSAGPGAVAEIPTYSSSKASFFTLSEKELANTLVATDYKDHPLINTDGSGVNTQSVRRLTPLECGRLQGYPDGWTDIQSLPEDMDFWREVWTTHAEINGTAVKTDAAIKKWLNNPTSDSAQYKALGNSVALPNVYYVLYGIAEQLGFEGTIGSLFDGIAGFPTCWENICGEGTALWASEVEPFPIAVTVHRFGGGQR